MLPQAVNTVRNVTIMEIEHTIEILQDHDAEEEEDIITTEDSNSLQEEDVLNWDQPSENEEDYAYDDYADLFSVPEETTNKEDVESEEAMYLDTNPEAQKERAQLILLRRHLDMLQEKLQEKEFAVLKAREELNACRTRTKALQEEQNEVANEIEKMEAAGNKAAYFRLVSQHKKLGIEIISEQDMEALITANLRSAELALSEVELEQRHYMNLGEKVAEKEKKVDEHKQQMAKYRLNKENELARRERAQWKERERMYMQQIQEAEMAHKEAIETALKNNIKARQFLQASLQRKKEKQAKETEEYQAVVKRRMDSILSLKNSIAANRENLRALQARDNARQRKRDLAEKKERTQVLSEGGNPEQVLLRKKKAKELQKQKKDFALRQSETKVKIVDKILSEEQRIEKRKKQQPQLWATAKTEKQKDLQPLKKKPVTSRIELSKEGKPVFLDQETRASQLSPWEEKNGDSSVLEIDSDDSSIAIDRDASIASPASLSGRLQALAVTKSGPYVEEELAKPEFEGLWTKKHKNYKVPKDEVAVVKPVGGSNMEQQILQKTLDRHRAGIVVKQVAAGREFKGQPFYSKPDVIHFKDFDVGKVYKKKIVITNVSYSMNFCKLSGLSEHLKDFIKIEFVPPGQMSAGMSCDMDVTFKPMINEDLDGEVKFLAQTGPFSIPLKCTTKKCDLSLDVDCIDFGSQVVGETIRRSVQLINKGALGTRFEFFKVPDKAATTYTTETSLGRLTTAESVAMTPVDESDLVKTATSARPETNVKSRRLTTKDGQSTAALTSLRQTDTAGMPFTQEQDRIKEMSIEIIEEGTDTERGIRSEGDEIKFASTVTDYSMLPEEIKVGQIMSGEIAPFSSVRLDIIFAPSIPGNIRANFRIAFSDQISEPLTVKTSATAIDVPVWVEKQNVDLRICMYDRLYQDQIIVKNRATTALRLNFEVPKELRDHIELLPKTGYIQAQSSFTAQLKFLPRKTLSEDAAGLFDPETGILEAPMVIRVADQTRPVPFTVVAIVTSSDMAFEEDEVDFGKCGIYESVIHTVKLTNFSILPQEFGFIDIPDYVDVQPNDGFGTILPLETIELDLILNADKARDYSFQLMCKSTIGREFPLFCRGVGVHPPLELTEQVVHFPATALGDTSAARINVVNSHVSANEFTHPVPRIGKGEIVPVGPTSFEFMVPEGAPISISPTVGSVNPGEKCHITIHFSPELMERDIREEAVHVMKVQKEEAERRELERQSREAMLNAKLQEEEKNAQTKGKKSKTPAKTPAPKSGKSEQSRKSTSEEEPIPTAEGIKKDSIAYKAANAALTRSFAGMFNSYRIPCYIASGMCDDVENPPTRNFNVANTLYLDVHCPTIKPPVVVISNHGQNLTEFGQVSIGQNTIKPISIQNISDKPLELTLSCLDTNGPFQVLNALRTLKPDETHALLVSFTPNAGKLFYEVLKILSPTSVLRVQLTGEGVSPVINTSVPDGILDLGDVLREESSTATFTLSNSSSLKVDYSVRLDSCSLLRHNLMQDLPDFVRRHKGKEPGKRMLAGPQNNEGSCVFDCVPCEGTIATGESHDITVTFNPDHSSRHFSDGARIVLFNLEEAHVIRLKGRAHDHMMFVDNYDPLDVAVESLTAEKQPEDPETEATPPTKTILLTFRSKINEGSFPPVSRALTIGCIRTNAFVAKKNGEWTVENLQHAQSLGFSVDLPKGVVDIDSTKPLEFTWTPPEGHDPGVPVESSVTLTLKADVPLTYTVLLRALLLLH